MFQVVILMRLQVMGSLLVVIMFECLNVNIDRKNANSPINSVVIL